jgi:hypothetical protein
MRKTLSAVVAAIGLLASAHAFAAQGTWTGTISDSACGLSHAKMTDNGKKGTDKQCTQECVMHGAKYVFVNSGKVLMIKNQDLAALKQYAGDRVTVTGDLSGDTITIANITAAKKS